MKLHELKPAAGSKKAYLQGELRDVNPIVYSNILWMPIETAAKVFNGSYSGDTLTIDGVNYTFSENSNYFSQNGTQKKLEESVKKINGHLYIPADEFAKTLNRVTYIHDGKMIFIAESMDMHTANYADIINGVYKALGLYM